MISYPALCWITTLAFGLIFTHFVGISVGAPFLAVSFVFIPNLGGRGR